MTTYYGVWSGEHKAGRYSGWWCFGRSGELFYTPSLAVAKAQAKVSNTMQFTPEDATWEARAIGEDGLPESEQPPESTCVEVKREFLHCAMAKCAMCGDPAREWVDVHIKGWMCEQHSHVSVGCLSEKEESTPIDLLADAEKRLRALPGVRAAHIMVKFILHRTACLLSPPQFAEYVQGVKAIAKTITKALGTDRGVSLIGTIGGVHAVDIMREG